MYYKELLEEISKRTGCDIYLIDSIFKSFIEILKNQLKAGGSVRLLRLGVFRSFWRKPSVGRNIKTGETMQLAATLQPKFVPSSFLKDSLAEVPMPDDLDKDE